MSRYPRPARAAKLKCVSCNAPVTTTIDDRFVCVECGGEVLRGRQSYTDGGAAVERDREGQPAGPTPETEVDDGVSAGPLVPADSDIQPDVSFVFPTMNEEEGIETAIDWAIEALVELGLTGEIIVSDSSEDRTPDIARERGALVVEPDKLGYGYAYTYGFGFTRGKYIVMGDPDCTYDFRQLPSLLVPIERGEADMVMGSRFEGEMEDGAMPALHRYVGNPLLTKFLNAFYDAGVTDAHSGFRVFTRETLERLDLRSEGMEFASEMVMDATEKGIRIAEVPITYRERAGEETLDSFQDGWRHVKFMLSHAPGYLFALPGALLAGFGLILMGLSAFDVQPGPITFGTHTMIAGSLALIVGFNVWELALFSTMSTNPIREANDPLTRWIRANFRLEHGASLGFAVFTLGTAYGGYLLSQWVNSGFTQIPLVPMDMIAFTAIVLGLETMFTSFHLSALAE